MFFRSGSPSHASAADIKTLTQVLNIRTMVPHPRIYGCASPRAASVCADDAPQIDLRSYKERELDDKNSVFRQAYPLMPHLPEVPCLSLCSRVIVLVSASVFLSVTGTVKVTDSDSDCVCDRGSDLWLCERCTYLYAKGATHTCMEPPSRRELLSSGPVDTTVSSPALLESGRVRASTIRLYSYFAEPVPASAPVLVCDPVP